VPSEKRARQRAAREERLAAEAQARRRRQRIRNAIIGVVVVAAIIGVVYAITSNNKPVGSQSSSTTTTVASANSRLQAEANQAAVKAGCPASVKTAANHQTYSAAPAMTIDTTKSYTATVKTTTGTFTIALNAAAAPKTVNNFVFLAQKGYFHCNTFFRVVPGFVNQSGSAAQTNSGNGGVNYTLPAENLPPAATATKPAYPVGSVAMATSSKGVSGNEFFIVAGTQGESLPNSYPLFGLVSSGENVIQTINQQGSSSGIPPDVTQRILSVTINES
jgi:cyclophilin family peptidyl-prolyl cis-trans isomerase